MFGQEPFFYLTIALREKYKTEKSAMEYYHNIPANIYNQ